MSEIVVRDPNLLTTEDPSIHQETCLCRRRGFHARVICLLAPAGKVIGRDFADHTRQLICLTERTTIAFVLEVHADAAHCDEQHQQHQLSQG